MRWRNRQILTLESILGAQHETIGLEPVWNFIVEHPEFSEALAETEPWLPQACDALVGRLPLPKTVGTFISKPFYRPVGSYRCFYYYPSSAKDANTESQGHAVIAIKGLEPCIPDLDAALRDLKRPCYSPHNIAEHLIFEEHKIPLAVRLPEALKEAQRAAEIQTAHRRAYGSLARLPLPLFVFRHSDETAQLMFEKLRCQLSEPAIERLKPWFHEGLGTYVYYYPTPPVRVRDVDLLLHGLEFRQRMFALMSFCDPAEIIRRWICGFVRMLYLGVLPGALPSLRSGICCQPQNSCIDGGFVDLDSLTPLRELRDHTAVYAALQFSTDALLDSVRALLIGSVDSTRGDGVEARFDLHHLKSYVFGLIQEAITSEARSELVLDARIKQYYEPAQSLEDLVDRLGPYYPTRNSDFADRARQFSAFGLSLIASAREG